jgi:signal transduction histidine kinase
MYGLTPFAMLAATVIGGTLAVWLLARHDRPSATFAFGGFMLMIAFWSATHVGSLLSTSERWLLVFTQLAYVSVVTVPVLWLVFALYYTGRGHWLSRTRTGSLLIVPALTLALVFTTQYHGLYYASIEMGGIGGEAILRTTPGPWHGVNIVYSYALVLVGTGLLVQATLTNNRLYRRQAAVLTTLVCFPWVVNIAYHLGVRPIARVDPTPLALVVVGIPLSAIVVRGDLTSFVPVARERVFRTLTDPVLVATHEGRVLDANRAARSVLGDGEDFRDAHVTTVLPESLLAEGSVRPDLDGTVECMVEHGGESREYLARRRDIDSGWEADSRGYIVSLTDITLQKDQQRTLERKNEQLERLADVVAHDMRTPLSTAEKLLSLLRADLGDPDEPVSQSLDDLDDVHDRLRGLAEHLPRLARESIDVETTETCDLESVATAAWDVVATRDVTLHVETTRTLRADRRRLQQGFENLFQNAVEQGRGGRHSVHEQPHIDGDGAHTADGGVERTEPDALDRPRQENESVPTQRATVTTVRVGTVDPSSTADEQRGPANASDGRRPQRNDASEDSTNSSVGGFYVEDDGPGIAPEQRETIFDYGMSTGDGSGFGLAIVSNIVESHGWTIHVGENDGGGARFEIWIDD